MKISQLNINNFMPYKGEQVINFPMHETQNVMLLFGDNMRGKTSFLNSIRWGFYGVALARHLRKIPRVNLINSEAAKDENWAMSVSVSFIENNKEYEIRREIKKYENIIVPNSDADFEETVGMRINGEPITASNYNYEINQVIPEEISRFFLFDGELLQEYENLLIEESEQGKKIKQHIEQVLGVPALIHARDELGTLLKDARALQSKDARKDKELQTHAETQKNLEVRLQILEKDKEDQKAKANELQEQIDELDDFLKNTEALQTAKLKIERFKQEKENTETKIKELQENNNNLLKTLWKDVLNSSVSSMLEDLREKRERSQGDLENQLKIKTEIRQLQDSSEMGNICNTCGQKIPEKNIQDIKEKIKDLKNKLGSSEDLITQISEIASRIDNLSSIKSEGESNRIIENIENITKSKIILTKLDNDIDELDEEIKGQDTDEIMRKREKMAQLEKTLYRIKMTIEQLDKDIEENNKKQEQISNIILRSQGTKGVLSSKRVEIYQNLQNIFKDGIDILRDKLREDVETYATNTFKKLTTEPDYSGLEINSNYGLSIINNDDQIIKERSAGAEQIVALSLIDGLNRTARKSGPIIMDTPLGRLDPNHRHNVLKFLPNMGEQIVLLVHEGEINPKDDVKEIANRIGSKYQINRISATQSRIERKE